MKKIVGIIAAAALCAGIATAQDDAGIRFGAWGRAIFSPIGFNGEDIITQGPQTSWGNPHRVGMSLMGVSDNVGFEANPDFTNEGVGTHDMDYVWVKPFGFLRIDIGQVRDQALQRNASFGMWNMVRPSSLGDESFTFTMLANGDDSQGIPNGMILKIDPVEALHIGVFMGTKWDADQGNYGTQLFTDTFSHYSAVSAGFKIGDIGQIMAGVWEQETAKDDDGEDKFWAKAEVAFDLTAVENLYLSIGVKIPTGFVYNKGVASSGAYTEPFQFNVYGNYAINDTIKLHALIGTKLYKYGHIDGGDWDDDMAFGARFGVGADIGIGEGLALLLDGRLCMKEYQQDAYIADEYGAGDAYMGVSFMVGLQKGFSNGSIVVGFEGSINEGFAGMSDTAKNVLGETNETADPDTFRFLVPIVLTYWF